MPDTPLPDSMELQEMEGVHEFLRQYIKLQQEFLDEFNGEEDGVYFYRYIVRERPNKTWPWQYITMENFDHAFLSLSECKRAIQEDIDYESPLLSGINFPVPPERCEEEEMVEIVVQRQMVSAYFEITAFLNERLEILAFDIPQKYLEPKGEQLMNAFKKMYLIFQSHLRPEILFMLICFIRILCLGKNLVRLSLIPYQEMKRGALFILWIARALLEIFSGIRSRIILHWNTTEEN